MKMSTMLWKLVVSLFVLFCLVSNVNADDLSTTTCPGNGCMFVDVTNKGSIGITISGTFSGTLTFYGSSDDTNYSVLSLTIVANGLSASTSTGGATYVGTVSGLTRVRILFTSYVSGTATVIARASNPAGVGSGSLGSGTNNIGKTNTQDTDDGSISGPQTTELNIVLPYGYNPTSGTWLRTVSNPCAQAVNTSLPISIAASATIITAPSNKVHICSLVFNVADAENVSIVEGTGTLCATNILAVLGGATAATGMNLLAGSGVSLGNGSAVVAKATVNANNLCILMSGTGRLAGVMTYVSIQ